MRVALLIAVGMALTISTAMRVHVFQDERLIWQDAVTKAPTKPRPWVNLGRQYALLGGDRLAEWAYETATALSVAPGRPADERLVTLAVAETNLGVLARGAGQADRARRLFAAATTRLPHDPSVLRLTTWTDDILAR